MIESLLNNSESVKYREILDNKHDYIRVDRSENHDVVLIVFSHTNYPAGKFAMSNVLEGLDVTKVFVNCSKNAWYQSGIDGVANSIDEAAEVLQCIIYQLKPKYVYTTGMSMGGYAAILFGLKLEVTAILAFTAEVLIGEKGSRSYDSNDLKRYDYRYTSLGPLLRANTKTKVNLVYGVYDYIDFSLLWSIEDVISNKQMNVFYLSGDHSVTKRLEIKDVLDKLTNKKEIGREDVSRSYCLPDRTDTSMLPIYRELRRSIENQDNEYMYELLTNFKDTHLYPELSYRLGIVCMDINKHEEALNNAIVSIELDKKFNKTHHFLGMVYSTLGDINRAKESLRESIRINPGYDRSYYRLGLMHLDNGEEDEAMKNFAKALELHPKYPEVNYKCSLVSLKNHQFESAERYIRQAMKTDPNNYDYISALCMSLIRQDKFEEAQAYMKKLSR